MVSVDVPLVDLACCRLRLLSRAHKRKEIGFCDGRGDILSPPALFFRLRAERGEITPPARAATVQTLGATPPASRPVEVVERGASAGSPRPRETPEARWGWGGGGEVLTLFPSTQQRGQRGRWLKINDYTPTPDGARSGGGVAALNAHSHRNLSSLSGFICSPSAMVLALATLQPSAVPSNSFVTTVTSRRCLRTKKVWSTACDPLSVTLD